jgi:RNA polymerase sigma factor (TIGR02999 family)
MASRNLNRPMVAESAVRLDELFERLYGRICALAARLKWPGSHPTLTAAALAHEAYLKLRKNPPDLRGEENDEKLIAIFANCMRQILIDTARRKNAKKRLLVELPEAVDIPLDKFIDAMRAIDRLMAEEPRQARIAECRFLLGMTVGEVAAALGMGGSTIERELPEIVARLRKYSGGQ